MKKFKPIYIYTQSLDNTSNDLMYQISHQNSSVVSRIEDLTIAQDIMDKMHDVALDKNIKNYLASPSSKILKKYISNNKNFKIYSKDSLALIKITTEDKDNLGRPSPIQILLDLPNFKNTSTIDYTNYFYNGFIEFCRQTGRHPKNIEILRDLPFLQPLDDKRHITPSQMLVCATVIIIILIIFLVLSN